MARVETIFKVKHKISCRQIVYFVGNVIHVLVKLDFTCLWKLNYHALVGDFKIIIIIKY